MFVVSLERVFESSSFASKSSASLFVVFAKIIRRRPPSAVVWHTAVARAGLGWVGVSGS